VNEWYNISYKGKINDQLGRIYYMKELIDKLVSVSGSREAVAKKLQRSESLISMLYTGDRKPTDDVLKKIKEEYPQFKDLVTAIQIGRID
jgi:hypothetical protein